MIFFPSFGAFQSGGSLPAACAVGCTFSPLRGSSNESDSQVKE